MKSLVLISSLIATTAFSAEIDLKKSSFRWVGTKVTGKHLGRVKLKKASIKTQDGSLVSGEFLMDQKSISVSNLKGKMKKKFERHIKSADFFDIKKYPTSKLVVHKVDSKNLYGKLTIKGKTNSITVPYIKKGNEYKGAMKFDRTKFDMVYGSGNFFQDLGDKLIYDEVIVNFSIFIK